MFEHFGKLGLFFIIKYIIEAFYLVKSYFTCNYVKSEIQINEI
jgi:hypothetical protein